MRVNPRITTWKSVFSLKWLGTSLLIAIAYYLTAKAGFEVTALNSYISQIWPASGVAVAVALCCGLSYLPAIFISSLLFDLSWTDSTWISVLLSLNKVFEAALAQQLLTRFTKFSASFKKVSDAIAFIIGACFVSCAVTAIIAACILNLGNETEGLSFFDAWSVWFAGDALGTLVVTPLVLSWLKTSELAWRLRDFRELALIVVCTAIPLWISDQLAPGIGLTVYSFSVFPFLLWAALRLGCRGATTITFLIAAFGVWSFLGVDGENRIDVIWQAFLAIIGTIGLLLGVLTKERALALRRVQESEQRYRLLFDSNPQPMWVQEYDTHRILAANDAAIQYLGYDLATLLEKSTDDLLSHQASQPGKPDTSSRNPSATQVLQRADRSKTYAKIAKQRITFNNTEAELVLAEDISERIRTRMELQRSEQRLALHIQQTTVGVIEWDRNHCVAEWNPAAENIFGILKEEALGKDAFDLIVVPEERKISETAWKRLTSHGQSIQAIRNNLTKSGTIIQCEWFHTPLTNENGEFIGVTSLVRDITERLHTQAALRESESRFRSIIESSPMGIQLFELNKDGALILTGTNPASEALFHISAKDSVGKPIEEAFPSFAGTQIPEMYCATAKEGRAWLTDQVVYDGNRVVGTFEVNTFRSMPGKVVAMYLDITERKLAENALRIRDKAMGAITQGIIITENTGDDTPPIIYVNPAFENIMQYTLADLKGHSWQTLLDTTNEADMIVLIEQSLREYTSNFVELRCRRKDGSGFLSTVTISPIFDTEGIVSHFVWVFTDITDHKRLEVQFRQSQKMEAIGRLAGGVAHDFNNLLTAIIGYNDLILLDAPDKSLLAENAKEIRKAAERASALTGQLLAFSRQQAITPRQVDLNKTILGTLQLLKRLIGEDIRIQTSLSDEHCVIRAEPSQIEQVILNLAVNARDAMPEGGTLSIHTGQTIIEEGDDSRKDKLQPGEYVLMTISDTGIGMDERTREHLFEPFFTTKEKGKGTGLGLATCYGIINQCGGTIRVQSAIHRGTTFEILVPLVLDPAHSSELVIPEQKENSGSETILLAEDDPAVRPLTSSILRSLGYTVMEATNGMEAKKYLLENRNQKIDLLLTDVVMPILSGKDLADWVRKNHPGIKILFTSGYLEHPLSREDVGKDDSHFLQKPFTPNSLGRKVRSVLDDL